MRPERGGVSKFRKKTKGSERWRVLLTLPNIGTEKGNRNDWGLSKKTFTQVGHRYASDGTPAKGGEAT